MKVMTMKHLALRSAMPSNRFCSFTNSPSPRHQLGLTLIELMVALVLGLVLVGGVLNVFVANREAYRSTENLTRIQENARTGFDFMARDIREAGQNPCGTPLVANVIRKTGAIPWWADWNKGTLIGVEGSQDRADIVAFGTTTHARVAGTDAVIVIRTEQNEKIMTNHDLASLEMTLQSVDGLDDDDVAVACDLQSASIFQIGTVSTSLISISYDSSFASLNCGDELGYMSPVDSCPVAPTLPLLPKTFSSGAMVAKLAASFWYVGYAENGQRSLYRTRIIKKTISGVPTITFEPEEMVPGVQDLQMDYLTGTGTTLADNWVTADNAVFDAGNNAWTTSNVNQAVAVRINMTLQSEENVGTNQQPIQRQLIHVVALRSRDYLF